MPTLRRSKSLNDKITRQKNRTGDVIRDPRSPDVEGRTRTCVDNFQVSAARGATPDETLAPLPPPPPPPQAAAPPVIFKLLICLVSIFIAVHVVKDVAIFLFYCCRPMTLFVCVFMVRGGRPFG